MNKSKTHASKNPIGTLRKYPYSDPRYSTRISIRDPKTGTRFQFVLYRHATIKPAHLLSSGLFDGLSGRALLTALWLCEGALFDDWERKYVRMPLKEMEQLYKFRARAKSLLARTWQLRCEFDALEWALPFPGRTAAALIDKAASLIHQVCERSAKAPTIKTQKKWLRERHRAAIFRHRDAIAYSLFLVLNRYSDPPISRSEIYRRIGHFQLKFLGHVIEPHPTIQRQISRLSRSSKRIMNGIVARQLRGEWLVL